MKITILGANGVYGRHLLPRLSAAGHEIRALVRRAEAGAQAEACGAEVRVADIFDEEALCEGLAGCDVAINLATSLPGPSGRGDFAANDRVRREGSAIWVEACGRAGVRRMIQQSIAMVNASGEAWADEDTTSVPVGHPAADSAVQATLAMERNIEASDLDWLILRGGLFYGPGTGQDDGWFAKAQAGKLRLPGDGEAYVSLVHIADMAEATVRAVDTWPSRQTLIVADDGPARWRDVFGYVAAMTGAAPPTPGGQLGFASFRVSNARAKAELGWSPFHRDFRTGLVR